MWFVLGLIGSVIMVVLEATQVTDIGYWWSLVPVVVGLLMQIGVADLLDGLFG